ncbi:MAG: hypothetical protein KKE05_02760, partial [Nanoarchaeota archaeon]|nr:hypothetical protein [Nanoarchaeota archaeon]
MAGANIFKKEKADVTKKASEERKPSEKPDSKREGFKEPKAIQQSQSDLSKVSKVKKIARKDAGPLRSFIRFLMILLLLSALYYFITKNATNAFVIFSGAILLFSAYLVMRKRLKRHYEIKKMEEVFPDFISLMSSNLRAGMTVDRALVLSARKEFAPLDAEIMKVGKDILTAREINVALY